MALVPPDVDSQALHVAARRVLLDALVALEEQRPAMVLVGAQAIYLRSGSANLGVAVFTSDADLGLDPALVESDPRLEVALGAAGFSRDVVGRQAQPGTWWRSQDVGGKNIPIAVDLLAAETLSDGGRGARIPPHDKRAVRRVGGIELAVEDNDVLTIASLDPAADHRSVELRVAGVPALLVAKAHKIRDRLAGRPDRLNDKDAADVYRLMTTADPFGVADQFRRLAESTRVGEVARVGVRLLREQFRSRRTVGVDMAVRALAGSVPEERIRSVAPAFVSEMPRF